MGLPQAMGFYPELPADTLVPARGFGLEAGAHVYLWQLGPARFGAGAAYFHTRATSGESVVMTSRILAPQMSFNFGSSEGWSYVSGGAGLGQLSGRFTGDAAPAERDSDMLLTLNVGGGARWFITPRMALSFDLRLHRLSGQEAQIGLAGTPATTLGSASVGLTLR